MKGLTTKDFASIVGVSEQTIRNLDNIITPDSTTANGHRRYSYRQVFDYWRLANENAILKNNTHRAVILLNKSINGVLLLSYLKSVHSDYDFELFYTDISNPDDCINRIASLGVLDSIYYLEESDNILSRYDIVLKRLGIETVCISKDCRVSFQSFVRVFCCLSVYDLFISQIKSLSCVLDDEVISCVLSNLENCVKSILDTYCLSDFKISLENTGVSDKKLTNTFGKLGYSYSDFKFCTDFNNFVGFSVVKNCKDKVVSEFLDFYHSYKRQDLDLFALISSNRYHDSLLKMDCIGGIEIC